MDIICQDNFNMYDNLQQALNQKRFTPILRPFQTTRFQDINAVEPWQKNTLEILIQEEPVRQFKTFYNTPKKDQRNKYYSTLRKFSFHTERTFEPMTKTKSVVTSSRKSAISHYNINGKILGDLNFIPKETPFGLHTRLIRTTKNGDKVAKMKVNQYSQPKLKGYQNLMEIKQKIQREKQKSYSGYIHFNSSVDQEPQHVGSRQKKSKVISLGVHKLALIKAYRQKSNKSKLGQQAI